ncbi:AAA family ATPase [Nitratiruptor tergarcus]|uniref:AAA+-type ATPase, SpoVK/Ycf46/Vps4 family n=1 Tax=Nitratiruptor tergarcus DSM 16512 TaxID=1069081 RepID=A0A1W1WQ84_9BACT|nr:ATP-binding protein [Nitratiruptor tergarcus]SMC08406.1 AAA+-type ATPase, SpoVK/Ycf46/Vps4 family [Nitratiruptor tergarcus DSM 16512]
MRIKKRSGVSSWKYVDKEVVDKITLWILRVIFRLDSFNTFLDSYGSFYHDSLAYFLGLEEYVNCGDIKKSEVFEKLHKKYTELEKRKNFTSHKILTNNLKKIASLMDLNEVEVTILEFVIFMNYYDILERALSMIDENFNLTRLRKALSFLLDIPISRINEALKPDSKLIKSGIISISPYKGYFSDKIEVISEKFVENICTFDGDITLLLKDIIRKVERKESLTLQDYEYISKDAYTILNYLKLAIKKRQKGVNILLYGVPGTGKTEFAKTIAKSLQLELFEVSYADEKDEAIDGYRRIRALKAAQALLSNKNILLLYDEAEDIFDKSDSLFAPTRQENKAWINKTLENNDLPTIWITNNIQSIDDAIIRRFDYVLELPIPHKDQRKKIIKKYSNNLLNENTIEALSEHEHIAPAIISRASKVVKNIETKEQEDIFIRIINNTLKAQGHKEIVSTKKDSASLPKVYDPSFVNTTTDLEKLTQGIKKHPNARICLYGPPGTGKSAFAKYIAKRLDKSIILKKASDLQSMWVGGTEKNIARAFEEARKSDAVLIFDEVDSFLQDRMHARASWEVSQVNEMLVQMENFDGIFIATTNLMDNLDKASLRRFDLKLKFDFLTKSQSWQIFKAYCKELGLPNPKNSIKKEVENLQFLTPGDFAAVVRQSRFRPIEDVEDFLQRLKDEVAIKDIALNKKMGFVAS